MKVKRLNQRQLETREAIIESLRMAPQDDTNSIIRHVAADLNSRPVYIRRKIFGGVLFGVRNCTA